MFDSFEVWSRKAVQIVEYLLGNKAVKVWEAYTAIVTKANALV